jgi:glycosyl transferase family 25
MWEFIDKVVYINLDKRPEKNVHMQNITSVFPPEKVQRFSAIEWSPGSVGCTKSHIAVMKLAIEKQWKNVLILEDDVVWNRYEQGYAQLEELIQKDYDVIHLGPSVPRYNINTFQLYNASTTSSYIINGHYIPTLLSNFEEGLELLVSANNIDKCACDKYWEACIQKDKWYTCMPCLMYQKEGYSDIDLQTKNPLYYWTLNPNMITVELQGGLGNQLFQLAFLDYVCKINHAIPFLAHTRDVSTHSQQSYFNTIFKNWKRIEKSDVNIHRTIREHNLIPQDWNLQNTNENIKFNGFFQHHGYIDSCFTTTLDFSDSFHMLNKYSDIETCVFLHVRGGDYVDANPTNMYRINYRDYYEKAISVFPKKTKFAIFTNDKAYAMKQSFIHDIHYQFIDENELDSLFLMSRCSGGICVNSTFSWWGGMLNSRNYNGKHKITIPSRWFNNPNMYSNGLYSPDFQIINVAPCMLQFHKGKFRCI